MWSNEPSSHVGGPEKRVLRIITECGHGTCWMKSVGRFPQRLLPRPSESGLPGVTRPPLSTPTPEPGGLCFHIDRWYRPILNSDFVIQSANATMWICMRTPLGSFEQIGNRVDSTRATLSCIIYPSASTSYNYRGTFLNLCWWYASNLTNLRLYVLCICTYYTTHIYVLCWKSEWTVSIGDTSMKC